MILVGAQKYRQWTAILLLLITALWVVEPVFHNFHDHSTEFTAKHKQHCVVCMKFSTPFEPAELIFLAVLFLVLPAVFICTFCSLYSFERQTKYFLRGPPSLQ